MCLAKCGLNGHPQAWTPLCWSPALEAATHSLLILLGDSLKAEGFGDGCPLAKHRLGFTQGSYLITKFVLGFIIAIQ
jgi:hypothetical protein